MRPFLLLLLLSLIAAAQTLPSQQSAQPATPQSSQSPAQAAQPAAASPQQPAASPEKSATQLANDASVAAVLQKIKGHEQEPASTAFKNIKFLTAVPAARFLAIMNIGYSRALGVKCEYCHDENDYSSEEKRPKRAAREMQVMHRAANDQLVKMQNLQPKPEGGHFINCTTCHRGMTDPTKPLPRS